MSMEQALTRILRMMENSGDYLVENDPAAVTEMFGHCDSLKKDNSLSSEEMAILDKILEMKPEIEKRIKLKVFW